MHIFCFNNKLMDYANFQPSYSKKAREEFDSGSSFKYKLER